MKPVNVNFDPSHLYAQPSTSAKHRKNQTSDTTVTPNTSFSNENRILPKISDLGETFKNSVHSTSIESNNSHSDHSGASGITLPLDIEYVDA